MKIFVTGGSGFIGSRLLQKLVNRGHHVLALARTESAAEFFASMGAEPVPGHILDQDSMRPHMTGCDAVFHCAGWHKYDSADWMEAETINVNGTRLVLGLAAELGVPRIIYTSDGAVFGDTHGMLVDESYYHEGPFLSEYERTKWLAHYKIALPLMEGGAPLSIAVPATTYGAGDQGLIGALMRSFYRGSLLFVPAPEFTVSYVHVDDAAEGLVKILESGQTGETYNLAGPAIPLGEMVDFWGQITGKAVPRLSVPARILQPFGSLFDGLRGVLKLPSPYGREALNTLSATYMIRGDKAKEQLGWRNRTLHDGMVETFQWIEETTPPIDPLVQERRRRIAGIALLTAAVLMALWLFGRKKK